MSDGSAARLFRPVLNPVVTLVDGAGGGVRLGTGLLSFQGVRQGALGRRTMAGRARLLLYPVVKKAVP